MPGKHAPESPGSFYVSLARAGVIGAVALGLIVVIVAVTLGARDTTGTPTAKGLTPGVGATDTATPTPDGEPSETPSESVTPSPSATPSGPPGARTVISVLNGTDRSGLAARIRAKILDAGYTKVTSANADATKRTVVFYRPGSQAVAEDLIALIPELRRAEPATDSTPKGAVVIVLGKDFDG